MKKSIIKRRKRVVPAQGSQASAYDVSNQSMESPESESASYAEPGPSSDMDDQRGSMNPDGSVNLGFRPRNAPPRTILPEPIHTTHHGQQQPAARSDLTAYSSSSQVHPQHYQEQTFNNIENRLPPMNAYPHPPRQASLSPNSFLSPRRKRSFTEAETNTPTDADSSSKRLSSIKSILNPSADVQHPDSRDTDHRLGSSRSPGPPYQAPSPGSYGALPTVGSSTPGNFGGLSGARDPHGESERAKYERRVALQREAEKMREMLAAKERELAELND